MQNCTDEAEDVVLRRCHNACADGPRASPKPCSSILREKSDLSPSSSESGDRAEPKRALSSTRYDQWRKECDRAEIDSRHSKAVRFADAMGLDLEVTKLYVEDELPSVPPEAYYHLSLSSSRDLTPADIPHEVTWTALFSQPYTTPYFHRNLLAKKVQLDHAFIHNMEISVTVRVVNICFEKSVFLRFTQNGWHTWTERLMRHLRHIPQHNVDVFCLKAPLPELSSRVEFALQFFCQNQEFWDNNGNLNYIFVQENRASFREDNGL